MPRWRGDWRRPPSLSPHSYGHLPLHIFIILFNQKYTISCPLLNNFFQAKVCKVEDPDRKMHSTEKMQSQVFPWYYITGHYYVVQQSEFSKVFSSYLTMHMQTYIRAAILEGTGSPSYISTITSHQFWNFSKSLLNHYFFIAIIIFTTPLCYYVLLRPSDLSVETFSTIIAIALADQKPVFARVKK